MSKQETRWDASAPHTLAEAKAHAEAWPVPTQAEILNARARGIYRTGEGIRPYDPERYEP